MASTTSQGATLTAATKFNTWTDYLCKGGCDLATDTIKVMLTNTAPVVTNAKYSDISANELANGNGYTTGGATVTGTGATNASGTESIAADATTFTSTTGNMGPFRYAVYYDDTHTDKPLIQFYDYGSSETLDGTASETFVITPASSKLFTLT